MFPALEGPTTPARRFQATPGEPKKNALTAVLWCRVLARNRCTRSNNVSETDKPDPMSADARTPGSRLNVRCDAALSAWDGLLSGMYLETLYALSRLRIH